MLKDSNLHTGERRPRENLIVDDVVFPADAKDFSNYKDLLEDFNNRHNVFYRHKGEGNSGIVQVAEEIVFWRGKGFGRYVRRWVEKPHLVMTAEAPL